jgi:hypothetical protein
MGSAEVGVCPCRAGPPNQGSDGGASGADQPHPSESRPPLAPPSGSWSARRVHGKDRPQPNPPHHNTKPQDESATPSCLKLAPAGGAVDLDLPDHNHHAGSQRDLRQLERMRGGRSAARTTNSVPANARTQVRHGAERSAGDAGERTTDGKTGATGAALRDAAAGACDVDHSDTDRRPTLSFHEATAGPVIGGRSHGERLTDLGDGGHLTHVTCERHVRDLLGFGVFDRARQAPRSWSGGSAR